MRKFKLGICIEDEVYLTRFTSCLLNHYKSQFELYIYTGYDQLITSENRTLNVIVVSDLSLEDQIINISEIFKIPVIYLADFEEDLPVEEREGDISVIEKYQEVNLIVEEILKSIGDEIRQLRECGQIRAKTRYSAVYSLSENEFQLPFAVTLGGILGEKEKVLLLDFQENSGLSQLTGVTDNPGLEEIIIMAESGRYTYGRMASCIGHMQGVDYVYPISNTDSLCELTASTCLKVIQMICQEMDYDVIIMNLGTRFQGFFEVLGSCHDVYLMQKKGGLCQWREMEFLSDLNSKGYKNLADRIMKVDIPIQCNPVSSCEDLIEKWRWNEFGDMIRNRVAGVYAVG